MKKLIECYQEYRSIMYSYRGDKTDWESACAKLDKLYKRISGIKITPSSSKNYLFYEWVKRALRKEVGEEHLLVERIVLRL